MDNDLRSLVERLKAVSHPLRLRVLALLGAGELAVCQVVETLGVPASSVSEALRELRRAGFVTERKEGRWVFVSIPKDPSPLLASLLFETGVLPETAQDRHRVTEVKVLPVQAVCQKHQAQPVEASHG